MHQMKKLPSHILDKGTPECKTHTLWVRHGEKNSKVRGDQPYLDDVPLTALGRVAVRNWEVPMSETWKGIVCSPYFRCYQTAMIISDKLKLPVTIDPRLLEIQKDTVDALMTDVKLEVDTDETFMEKLDKFIPQLHAEFPEHIFVTHGGVLSRIMRKIEPKKEKVKFGFLGVHSSQQPYGIYM